MSTLTQKSTTWAIQLPGGRWHEQRSSVKFDDGTEVELFNSQADAEGRLRELRARASELGVSEAFAVAKVVALQLITIAIPVLDEVAPTAANPFGRDF